MSRRRHAGLGSLGASPATDTTPLPTDTKLSAPISIGAILVVAIGLGGLVYLTEKDKGSP